LGASFKEIADEFGLNKTVVEYLSNNLRQPDKQRRRECVTLKRARNRADQFTREIERPAALRPETDKHYAQIRAALPKGMDPTLADDAAQDAYLAELEGRLSGKGAVRKIVNSNYDRFASKWGALSLDELAHDDGSETYLDSLEDPSALAAFDLVGFADEKRDW
jgi:hypothetical protein